MSQTPEQRLFSARVAAGERSALLRIRVALKRHRGSVTRAAESLGVSRATLHRWMAQHGIEGRGTPGPPPPPEEPDEGQAEA